MSLGYPTFYITALFLANRAPHDLAHLPEHDPARVLWLQQLGGNDRLPKIFRQGQSIRIHKPRLFKRFPLKHLRMKSGLATIKESTSASSSGNFVSPAHIL